jgi:hypothetical protein
MRKSAGVLAIVLYATEARAETRSATPIADAVRSAAVLTFVAQPAPQPAVRVTKKWERWLLKGCLAFHTFGQFFDTATTIRAVNLPGFRERNIILAPFADADHEERLFLLKGASWAGSTYAYVKTSEKHPRWTALLSCATGAIGTYAGASNHRLIRGQ